MELHKKLVQIQSELKAPKNQRNTFGKYNYRSAEDILEALKPHLREHRLTLTIDDDVRSLDPLGIPYIESTVILSDGEHQIKTKAMAGIDPQKKGMDVSQTFGAASSYARKYAMNGMFMIDDTKDADATNDHGKASKSDSKPQSKKSKVLMTKTQFEAAVKAYNEGDEAKKKEVRERVTSKYTLSEEQSKLFYNKANK